MAKFKTNIHIIDHKKVWMTPDEKSMYESICNGYNKPNFQGKDLFQDHFEVNDDGVILFVKPPHKKYSSMEVFTFLVSLQINQHLRILQEQNQALISETEKNITEKTIEVESLKKDIQSLKEEVEQLKEVTLKGNSKRGKTNDRTD
jgi:hypothetical protein